MFPHKKYKSFLKEVEKHFELSFSIKECLSLGGVGVSVVKWQTTDPKLMKCFYQKHFKDENAKCDSSNPIHICTAHILTADVGGLLISVVYNTSHVSLMAVSEEGDVIEKLY